jgi:dienelactone hydrolase
VAGPGPDSCVPRSARVVHLRPSAYTPLTVAVLGAGPRGIVLSNESDEDLCSWLPLAKRLVGSGFRVALYDYSGLSPVADAVAVSGELRRLGARTVGVVGASEGAKASIVAAGKVRAAAVVSFSAERLLSGVGDLLPVARRLRSPILYLYARGDPLAEAETPQLFRATREADKRLVGFPGIDHGTRLLTHASVPSLVVSFLRDRLSPRRTSSVATAPVPSLAARCGGHPGGTTFWFTSADGSRLDGAVLGTGSTGVVLATESPGDVCRWLPEALVLRKQGLRVFLFDFRGMGLSPLPAHARVTLDYASDVVGAARELRACGARRIYLMGASLGGTSVIAAAVRIRPAVTGVVSLSGEADLTAFAPDLDAVAAARRLHVPVLYVVSKYDPLTPPADVARVRAALRTRGSRVVVFPDAYHGWDLLYSAPYRARVAALVRSFLRR